MNQTPTVSNDKSFKVLGLNLQPLRYHRDELVVEFDRFKNKPSVKTIHCLKGDSLRLLLTRH